MRLDDANSKYMASRFSPWRGQLCVQHAAQYFHIQYGRMHETKPMSMPLRLSIAAMFVLGLLGGTLIMAHSGFETSPRRGGTSVFVPLPEAYVIAATMYGMSLLAMLALLRSRTQSVFWAAVAVASYVLLAGLFVRVSSPL